MKKYKKTMFYNNSPDAYLGQRNYIDKMWETIKLITQIEGLRVWWRPHPKFKETVYLKSKSDYKKYEEIISYFKSNRNHIFDESDDYNTAFIKSDLYYGEGGTVYQQFIDANKMVFYQRMEYESVVDDFINFFDGATCHFSYEGKMYGFLYYLNMMFEYDPIQKVFYLKNGFPNHPIYGGRLSEYPPQVHEGEIYFMPGRMNEIPVYNPKTEAWRTIPFNINTAERGKPAYSNILFWKNEIIVTPFSENKIVRLDKDSGEIIALEDVHSECKERICLWGNAVIVNEHYLIINSLVSNEVVFYDLIRQKLEIRRIGKENSVHSHIDYYNGELIIVEKNKFEILRYDLSTGCEKLINKFPSKCKLWGESAFGDRCSKIIDGRLYTFPAKSNIAIEFSLQTNEVNEIKELTTIFEAIGYNPDISVVDGSGWDGNTVYLQCQNGKMVVYNVKDKTGYVRERHIRFDDNESYDMRRKTLAKIIGLEWGKNDDS